MPPAFRQSHTHLRGVMPISSTPKANISCDPPPMASSESVLTQFQPSQQVLFAGPDYVLIGEHAPLARQVIQTELANQGKQWLQQAHHIGCTEAVLVGALPFQPHQTGTLHLVPQAHWVARQATKTQFHPPTLKSFQYSPTPQQYQNMVAKALDTFQDSALQKVVLGRTIELEFEHQLDVGALLCQLAIQNPTALTFALQTLHQQNTSETYLIGASPEMLISKRGKNIRLQPMAGTLPRSTDQHINEQRIQKLQQSPKDHYEHQVMIQDIRERLSPFCHTLNIPDKPEIIATPALMHLATPIHGELKDPSLSVLDLVEVVHPTPAVCGVPQDKARAFITEHEPERGLFAGTVGWCDTEGNGDWAVTIRCAECTGQHLKLFAGAGVVEGSVPEQECAETAAKFRTMLRALGIDLPEESA